MDKIKKYLEFVFSDFQATNRVVELKEEIQTNLIEKMNDYMSEEEASLKAIGSLGNIEDVLKEIGGELIQSHQEDDYMTTFLEALNDRSRCFRKGSIWISSGVFLCIMSVIGFASGLTFFGNETLNYIYFFGLLLIAIPMFILSGVIYFNVDDTPIAQLVKTHHDQTDFKQYLENQKSTDQRKEVMGGFLSQLELGYFVLFKRD